MYVINKLICISVLDNDICVDSTQKIVYCKYTDKCLLSWQRYMCRFSTNQMYVLNSTLICICSKYSDKDICVDPTQSLIHTDNYVFIWQTYVCIDTTQKVCLIDADNYILNWQKYISRFKHNSLIFDMLTQDILISTSLANLSYMCRIKTK